MKREVVIIVGFFLTICGIWDWKKRSIPCQLPLAFGILGIARQMITGVISWQDCVSGVSIGAVFLVLGYVTREAVGYGDGLIILTTGIFLGFCGNLRLLFYGLILSSLGGGVLLSQGKGRKAELPFAPFLAAGFLLMVWMGG